MKDTPLPLIGTLMVIDDSKIDHRMVGRIVEKSGIVGQMLNFVWAEEALEYIRSTPPPAADAIILDINMPRMDGFEFLEAASDEFGEDFARVVVMMLTTSLDPRDVARAETFPVVREFCHKPLIEAHLKKIAALLRQG